MNDGEYTIIFFDFLSNLTFKDVNDKAFNQIEFDMLEKLDDIVNSNLTVEICEELDEVIVEEIK